MQGNIKEKYADELFASIVYYTIKEYRRIVECCLRPIFTSGSIGFSINKSLDVKVIIKNGSYLPFNKRPMIYREYIVAWLRLKIKEGSLEAVNLLKQYVDCYQFGAAYATKLRQKKLDEKHITVLS